MEHEDGRFANIRIVMVRTSHPGNIGAAARAMKTMGLSRLVLVSPEEFPSARATARASGAADLLETVQVVSSLSEAVADCQLVIGTSSRQRRIPWPLLGPRRCAEMVSEESGTQQVAIVFGAEDSGLSNEELQRCNLHLSIPANPIYGVMNVAAAVQVVCYELRMAILGEEDSMKTVPGARKAMPLDYMRWDEDVASAADVDQLLVHFDRVLQGIGFYDPANPKQLPARLRRLFARARPDRLEVNLLRGVLARIEGLYQGAGSAKDNS